MTFHARRVFLGRLALAGFSLTPLAAALSACGEKEHWPQGMAKITWNRNTCVRCNMVISDRRFAAELQGGLKNTDFKFDDIGCLVFWMRDKAAEYPWMAEAATRLWVADYASKPDHVVWLDARQARYLPGRKSPMGYGFAASSAAGAEGIEFLHMREQILAKGK